MALRGLSSWPVKPILFKMTEQYPGMIPHIAVQEPLPFRTSSTVGITDINIAEY